MASSVAVSSFSVEPTYASLSRRIAAYALDFLILFSLLILVAITMRLFLAIGIWTPIRIGAAPNEMWATLGPGAKLLMVLAYIISMGPVYFTLFHASSWQATFGKRLLNTYVTNDAGERITLARSCGRWFAMWVLSFFGGSLVSLITIPTSKNRKALHDGVAGTLVLRGQPANSGSLEPWRVLVAFCIPYFWILATLLATI